MQPELSQRPFTGAPIDAGPLSAYMRDLSAVTLMSKEEESAAALHLITLRRRLWAALLDYLPFTPAIVEVLRARLPAEVRPEAQLAALEIAARQLRDRRLRRFHEAHAAARDALAEAMQAADLDGVLADELHADLTRLAQGRGEPTHLAVKAPPRGSATFARHVDTVGRRAAAVVAARNAFVRANLRLVVAVARSYRRSDVPLQDLIQEGNLGLMKAVDRFDPTRGLRFSTYGIWWIRHAIQRSIADKARTVRVPVHMLEACRRLRGAYRELTQRGPDEPSDEALADASGVSVGRLQRMRWSLVSAPVSLSQPIGPGSDEALIDTLVDEDLASAPEQLDARGLRARLREALARLSPIEVDILRQRIGLDGARERTLQEIGADYALSRERIRQLQLEALAKLRAEFSRRPSR
jgi:RNA polymerase primary sigma factor